MRSGTDGLGKQRRTGFRPRGERLEARQLLAIDLTNYPGNDTAAGPGPYGVLEAGGNNNGGAGFSVAEVGDVNGDGFDDFLIGAPSIIRSGGSLVLGSGSAGRAYLVFGSAQVNAQTIDFRTLTAQQRTGDLLSLGNPTQNNPVNGTPGLSYNGLTFLTSQNATSAIGASVAALGDINGDGYADFLIGAPGANDASGAANAAGRAYLVYGGPALSARANKQVDFDNPTANTDLNILTFTNTVANGAVGRSVASAGDILADGLPDIAIGAPNATVNALPGSGAVYVISGVTLRPARTQTISLATVGQGGATNTPGIVFSGAGSGDAAGYSIASAGNVGGQTVNATAQTDLLIGAPQFNVGAGEAYLVYATTSLAGAATTVGGFSSINLGLVGSTVTGAVFTGAAVGDQTGFSVASAGDFNNDGFADFLIGSPGFNALAGRVNLIEGRSATPTTPGLITGSIPLSAIPQSINNVEFDGATAGSLAGFSVTATGRINNDTINEIAIGSPGANAMQGVVYLIPGNPDLAGTFNLTSTESLPIQGLMIGLSQPAGTGNFLGTSVSGRLVTNGQGNTLDADAVGDLIVGAAGYGLNSSRVNAGGVFGLEGAFLPLPNVVSTAITSPIGVGQPLPPFQINATTPDALKVYVLSGGSNTPGFNPFRDIDPTTITLNGIPLPDPTTWTQDIDEDGDGIPDAYFTFSPRSLLGLANGTTTFTVAARTLATSPTPGRRYTGTATVTVVGSSTGGGSGGVPATRSAPFFGFPGVGNATLPNGERLVPQESTLVKLKYKPLSPFAAHKQFLPVKAFAVRTHNFFHPKHIVQVGDRANSKDGTGKTYTLGKNVFQREKFPNGTFTGKINHKGPTVPPT